LELAYRRGVIRCFEDADNKASLMELPLEALEPAVKLFPRTEPEDVILSQVPPYRRVTVRAGMLSTAVVCVMQSADYKVGSLVRTDVRPVTSDAVLNAVNSSSQKIFLSSGVGSKSISRYGIGVNTVSEKTFTRR
jgi:hypothetical protein